MKSQEGREGEQIVEVIWGKAEFLWCDVSLCDGEEFKDEYWILDFGGMSIAR